MAVNVTVPPFDVAPETVVGGTPRTEFPFEFPFWDATDIIVRVDGEKLDPSAYTVEGLFLQDDEPVEGGFGSGIVTLNDPVNTVTVTIDRYVTGIRDTQFSKSSPLPMTSLNADLNKTTARQQDLERRIEPILEFVEDPSLLQDAIDAGALAAAAVASVVPRVGSIPALEDKTWPLGRPLLTQLDQSFTEFDGGSRWGWIPDSTAPTEYGVVVQEEAAPTAGRWQRKTNAPFGPQQIDLEDLRSGIVGMTSDTSTFERALEKMLLGYRVHGIGGPYNVEGGNLIFDASNNDLWEDPRNSPVIGGLYIPGVIHGSGSGDIIRFVGSQGGAKGHLLHIGGIIGEDAEGDLDGLSFISSGYDVTFGYLTDLRYCINFGGGWSGNVQGNQVLACHTGFRARIGSNTSTTNGVCVRINHIGGPFSNGTTPERALRSPRYGVDLDYWNGGHLHLGAAEYCHRGDENCAVRLGQDVTQLQAHFYLEGAEPLNPNSNLLQDYGRNNRYTVSSSDSPNVALGGIELHGIKNEMRGVGSRTGPAPRQFLTPEDGAGPIDIWPGNSWIGAKTAHIEAPNLTDPYNINIAGFPFWGPNNVEVELVAPSSGELPPGAALQSGVILTTNNAGGGILVSPQLSFVPVDYDRLLHTRVYVKLEEFSETCSLCVYLLKDILDELGAFVRFEALTYDNGFSQGVKVADRVYRLDISEIIPAGVSYVRLCLAQRRSQMPEPIVVAATRTNPLTVTMQAANPGLGIVGHAFTVGDNISFFEIDGMTQLNGQTFEVTAIAGDVLTFSGVNATAWGTFTRGITAATRTNPLTVTMPGHTYIVGNTVTFSGVAGMTELNGQTLTITAISGDVLTFGAVDATEYSRFLGRDGYAASEITKVLWSLPVPSFWENPFVQSNLVPPGPHMIDGDVLMSPLRYPDYEATPPVTGILDLNYAPMIKILAPVAPTTSFANLPPEGNFEMKLVNVSGGDVTFEAAAFTGGSVAGVVLKKGRSMTVQIINGLVYPDN